MLKIFISISCYFVALALFSAAPDSTGFQNKKFIRVQYAGNLGLLAVGTGKEFLNGKAYADLNLGYLPKHVNGIRVFTLSFKPSVNVAAFDLGNARTSIYAGAAINYSIGRKIYGKIPDYYPRDYYWPNAFHFNPFTGIMVGPGENGRGRFYVFTEIGTVDYEIWFAAKNRRINVFEILNLALGFMVRIPQKGD